MFTIRERTPSDDAFITAMLEEHWGSSVMVSRGRLVDASSLPGFIAEGGGGKKLGVITLAFEREGCEVVTLNAFEERKGIGRSLLLRALEEARSRGLTRVWLITSNDNVDALVFYQKVGMRIAAIHRDAITEARRLKPQIPLVASNGIPICDEIELEMRL